MASERKRKYAPDTLLPPLRLFIEARNKALEAGFTDNGGAIHSVERILDILCQSICYPHLSHINSLKTDQNAEVSFGAEKARRDGGKILIEHVMPQRAFAQRIIGLVTAGISDHYLKVYIKYHYRLVLLNEEETTALNRLNRSEITKDRIAEAGIRLVKPSGRRH